MPAAKHTGQQSRIKTTVMDQFGMDQFGKKGHAPPAARRAMAGHARLAARRRGKPGWLVLGMALAGSLLAGPARAQDEADVPAPSAQGQIVIPSTISIFGKTDPNFRRPTAIVNGDIITGTDVDQRLKLYLAANNNQLPPDEVVRFRLQILRNLIDETLEIQEAKVDEIKIDEAEVEQAYDRVAEQNFKQTPEALDAYLARIGSSAATLKRQIRGEIAWRRVLNRDVQPFVNVSEGEVKELMARMQAAKGTEEYRVGEIFLSATPESAATVRANAQQIVDQLKKGGSFVAFARQYSEASTAAVGGDLGWIRLGQLPSELASAVQGVAPGTLVGPLEVHGGFDIILLRDKRGVLTADPRDAVLALKQVTISLPKGITEAEAARRATDFGNALKAAKGCGNVDMVAAKINAQVVANDQVPVRNLPPQMQDVMLKMTIGEMTPPFGSVTDGLRVLMLCGRDDPKVASGPSFDDIMERMEDDRVNKRAQMFLRDLRRDAIIEYN